MPIDSFSIPFSQLAVDDLCDRLRQARWLEEVPESRWTYGFERWFLQDICEYWRDHFNWEDQVKRLSALHHYRYLSNGTAIHFIRERGSAVHAHSDAGELGRLEGDTTRQHNPRLRANLRAAGTNTGDKHKDEQYNRKPKEPRH